MEKIRVRRAAKKCIYIHNDLSKAARYFRDVIEKKSKADARDAVAFDCMACLIMLAFTLEAHINFLGDRLIDGWKEKEAFEKKVAKLLRHLKVTRDESKRPYSSIGLLMRFRNTVAHGKPSKEESVEIVVGNAEELDRSMDLSGEWEKDCNKNVAFQAYEDVEAVWKELLEKSGLSISRTITYGERTTTLIERMVEA